MIWVWEPVEQHTLLQLDFNQNSKSLSMILKYEYYTLKVLAIKDSLFGQLVGAHLWCNNVAVTILSTGYNFEFQQERLRLHLM